MRVREEYPAGVPCWVDISPPDVEAAAAFYGSVFGWQFVERTPAGVSGRYLVAQLEGKDVAGIGSPVGDLPPSPAWSTSIAVDDAGAATTAVIEAGGQVVVGPVDVPGAGRVAVCTDPAGAGFKVWQAMGRSGAQLVNGPGTWNFSDLTTTDPEGARAFYGSVFGWEARSIDFGPEPATMWCVPGYGDFLAALDPELRRRHAEPGVPEGFSDAIGWMSAATDDSPGGAAPPAWTVTFAADDTDAVVDRAVQAGGQAVVPPFDAGVARVAIVEDPQGATFTVSHYQPGG